jgi:predicted ArsR family transcriptional regulator
MTEPETAPETTPPRRATAEDLRALTHPLSWRILRLCLDHPMTNQQLAERLSKSPATVLRQVRALVEGGFLVAEPVRRGTRGARERPYRATGRTWRLDLGAGGEPALAEQAELATLDAHRAELLESTGPRDIRRGVLQLTDASRQELHQRLDALLDEYIARPEPEGRQLSYLWNLISRPEA